jgi:hypothetical protein
MLTTITVAGLTLDRGIGRLCVSLEAEAVGAQPALHWYKGNTHAHTINSDGDASPDVVARWYKEHDYQFLFITDHEYVTDAAALNAIFGATERFLLLPGQEVTQWGDDPKRSAAHINALFAKTVVWPVGERRCLGSGCGAVAPASTLLSQTFDANIAAVKAEGALAQVNHPNYHWSVRPEDLLNIPDGTLLEVWNGQGGINNLGGDDGAGDVRPSAEGYWDYLLTKGKIIWGVGSDDSHSFTVPEVYNVKGAAPGQAWIMVHAPELTPAAIRKAMEHGDFYASTGVTLDTVDASAGALSLAIHENRPGAGRYITRFVGKDGKLLAEVAGIKPSYKFIGSESYVRAAVMDSNGRRAWTQPVFLDARKGH